MDNQNKKRENIWFFAWAVSVIATLGSLYFSEIRLYVPCELCWFQRILMYPLTVLIGMSVVRKEYQFSLYATVLSGIGLLTSLYHYSIQKFPALSSHAPSCGPVSCNAVYINWFGFITISFLALVAFILIFVSSIVVYRLSRKENI